jgi:hypothetical protein
MESEKSTYFCKKGYILTTSEKLREVFGKPSIGDKIKTNVEWMDIEIAGEDISIYDWKESDEPIGLYWWHVGGYTKDVVKLIAHKLKLSDDCIKYN